LTRGKSLEIRRAGGLGGAESLPGFYVLCAVLEGCLMQLN
jgi:hypothetical protein